MDLIPSSLYPPPSSFLHLPFLPSTHSNQTIMSERGRSRSPKPLSPLKGGKRDISMSRSRSRSPPRRPISTSRSRTRSLSRSRTLSPRKQHKGNTVIVITGLTKNVQKGHLEEIFGVYGRIVAIDLPTFEVCMSSRQGSTLSHSSRDCECTISLSIANDTLCISTTDKQLVLTRGKPLSNSANPLMLKKRPRTWMEVNSIARS